MGDNDLFDFNGSGSLDRIESTLKSDEEHREMKQILSGGSPGRGGGSGKNPPGSSASGAQGSGKKPLFVSSFGPVVTGILWALTAFGFIAFLVFLFSGGD